MLENDATTGRRAFWLRFLLWVAAPALLLLIVVGAYVGISIHVLDGKFAARMESLRDAGEPVSLDEFVPPEVPDDANGAADILRAIELLPELDAEGDGGKVLRQIERYLEKNDPDGAADPTPPAVEENPEEDTPADTVDDDTPDTDAGDETLDEGDESP